MVNFNNDSTISKPPIEIVNLIVIEHWYNFRLAYEYYVKFKMGGSSSHIYDCRARLCTLFISIYDLLKRKLGQDRFTYIKEISTQLNKKPTDEEILDSYLTISEVLDEIGLTKLDTKPYVNRQKIEDSNKASGY